jgi:hypothetical protein
LAARSRSASESTIIGSLPPSSSEAGISRLAAVSATLRPVLVEPVNMIMSTWSTSAAPVSPRPVAICSTCSGSPHSSIPSASNSEVKGVISEGLRITLLPAASAGMQSPKEFVSG